jgi:hypothetical protein
MYDHRTTNTLYIMKKLVLFALLLVLTFSISGCSGDDDTPALIDNTPGGVITFKLNGITTTYNTVVVIENSNTAVPIVTVTGLDGTSQNTVYFSAYRNSLGADVSFYFTFVLSGQNFFGAIARATGSFHSNIVENDEHHIKGAFAGEISTSGSNPQHKNVTDGTFDIRY